MICLLLIHLAAHTLATSCRKSIGRELETRSLESPPELENLEERSHPKEEFYASVEEFEAAFRPDSV